MASDISEPTMARQAIPMLSTSNARIKKDAKKALETLEALHATDLIDALGLRPYVKVKKNA